MASTDIIGERFQLNDVEIGRLKELVAKHENCGGDSSQWPIHLGFGIKAKWKLIITVSSIGTHVWFTCERCSEGYEDISEEDY